MGGDTISPMIDKHPCPKCNSEMIKQDTTYALVQYADRDSLGKDGSQINPKNALPVEVYWCENCRRVELVAS